MGSLSWDGQARLEREADLELARASTPSLILMLDALRESHPLDKHFAALMAKAYGQYAYGFFEEDLLRFDSKDPKHAEALNRAQRFYSLGKDAGLKALSQKTAFRKGLQGSQDSFERALRSFGKGDVPLLFWTAVCWASDINLHRDDPASYIEVPRVSAMMDRVLVLHPSYTHGAAYAFRGVLESSRPPMLGGSPARAKASFEKAIAVEPRYLLHKVLFAQFYAVQVQDRELYERLLHEVRSADTTLFPEQRLANEIARKRAELLLQQVKRWF